MLGFLILILQQMIDGWQHMGTPGRQEPGEGEPVDVGLTPYIETMTEGNDPSEHADLGDLQDEQTVRDRILLAQKLRTCLNQKSDLEKKFEKSQYEKSSLEDSLKQCQLENCRLRDRLEQNNKVFGRERDTDVTDPECQGIEEMTGMEEPVSPQAISMIEMALRCTVHPFDVIPVLLIFDCDVLTVPEREQIQQDTNNYGRSQGASSLLDCLRRHVGWLETLVRALSHPFIKLTHVAQVVGKAVGFDSETMIQLMREGEFPYNHEIGDQELDEGTLPKTEALAVSQDGENKDQAEKARLQEENNHLKAKLQEIQDLREKDFRQFLDNMDVFTKKQHRETELEWRLRTAEQQNAELEKTLVGVRQENCQLMKEKYATMGETEEAGLAETLEIQQSQIGFLATVPAGACQSITQGERLRCFTEVEENPGGHYNPSGCEYTISVTGRYQVRLTHSQRAEDRKGGIQLAVVREWREPGCEEWKRFWLGPKCDTMTFGRKCKWQGKDEKLTDSFVCETDLDEGDRLWVMVGFVVSDAKLKSPCSFSCQLLSS